MLALASGQGAAVGHGIACIDRQIDQRELELIGIDLRRRKLEINRNVERDPRPDRAMDQIRYALDQRGDIDRSRLEMLAAGECEQSLNQGSRAIGSLDRTRDQAQRARLPGEGVLGDIERTDDRGQQIVEIMRHAASQLAKRFDFLRLEQCLLGLRSALDLFRDSLGKRLFNLFLFVDVDHRPDIAKIVAVGPEQWRGGVDCPAIAAVGAAQPIFDLETYLGGIGGDEGFARHLAIVGMHRFQPAVTKRLLLALAGKFIPGLRQEGARPVRISHPHHHRRLIGKVSKARLAFAHGLLGVEPRRVVAKRQDRSDLLAVIVADRARRPDCQYFAMVGSPDPPAGIVDRLTGDDGTGQRKVGRRVGAPVLGEQMIDVAILVGRDIKARDAVNGLRRTVDQRQFSFRVGDDHALRQLVENGAQMGFAFAHRGVGQQFLSGFGTGAKHAGNRALIVPDRGVGKIVICIFGIAVAKHYEMHVLMIGRLARER